MPPIKFNQQKHFIIINNEIKENISTFQYDGNKINIFYKRNTKKYPYNSSNVTIYQDPKSLSTDKLLYYVNGSENQLFNLKEVLYFGDGNYRFFYANGGCFATNNVKVIDNPIKIEKNQNTLSYLKDILQSKTGESGVTDNLKRQYQQLDFIHPDSVLKYYLEGKSNNTSSYFFDKKLIYPFNFNPSQKTALENIFQSNISVIEGPPGTGKTQTILNIIANLSIMQNKSVAIVSNNNSAIENIQEKLEKNNYSFFSALLGKKEQREHFFKNIPKIHHFDIKDKNHSDENIEEILELMEGENSKKKLQTELSYYKLEQEHYQNYSDSGKIEENFKLPLWTKTPDKLTDFLVENAAKSKKIELSKKPKKKGLLFKIQLFVKYGFTEFKKFSSNEIDIILSYQKQFYELKISQLEKEIEEIDKKLKDNNFDTLKKEFIYLSQQRFQTELNNRYSGKDNFQGTVENYKKDFSNFLDYFPVLLSGTHSLLNSIPKGSLLDYVIIDEASQVDLVTAILVMSCCKNLIVVGDTNQLSHITNGEKTNLQPVSDSYDYFKENILSSIVSLYGDTIPKVLLKEHYRCHPQIINFCNEKYYNSELIIHTDQNQSENPLVVCKTVEGNHMRTISKGENKGKYSQRELDSIENFLKDDKSLSDENDIGIITPFSKQAAKGREKFGDNLDCYTIHKYQGREKNTVIFSTVLSNTRDGNIALKFADDPKLVNVAVSRAKDKFIIVTDSKLFFKKGKEIKDLINYCAYSTLDENIIESNVVGVFDLLYKKYSDKIGIKIDEIKKVSQYKSENIGNYLINEILSDEKFSHLTYKREVYLKHMINNTDKLDEVEKKFLQTTTRVDFLIYANFGKLPFLVIEVDGFEYHENNPEQQERDKKKNSILEKYNIPYLRLPTNGSGDKEKIIQKLNELIENDNL